MTLYIQTAFGGRYQPLDPDPDQITLKEIAHALSNLCRFTGHCSEFYSVAQHCVLMARAMTDEGRDPIVIRCALMHDAHEAYVGDMASPLKRAQRHQIRKILAAALVDCGWTSEEIYGEGRILHTVTRSGFDAIEAKAWAAVAKRFHLPRELPAAVKEADLRMLVTEAAQLLSGGMQGDGWPDAEPYDIPITPWIPERARIEFLAEAGRCSIY